MDNVRILFVCLGNICRSPAAEIIMRKLVEERGLTGNIEIDSAGLLDYHQGEQADVRMRRHARERGYEITHLSRPVRQADFCEFDIILGMDDENMRELRRLAAGSGGKATLHKLTEFSHTAHDYVPDPYYGGPDGFELVLDIVEDACSGLLDHCV